MTIRRFTTPQRGFVLALRSDAVLDEAATRAEVLRAARRAWDEADQVAHLMFALGTLDDRRELARATCVVLRHALSALALALPRALTDALETIEAWAAGDEVSEDAMARVIAIGDDRQRDEPPGPTALMAMAVRSAAMVLDPAEDYPATGAADAAEVAADACAEGGVVAQPAEARRAFVAEIRRAVSPWAAWQTSTRPYELAPDDAEDIPF